jgi:membrane protease YdiL (CAAX protease family)
MNTNTSKNRSLLNFSLLEFALSIPFWTLNALAGAGVIPNLQMLNASWSLTPMMAAVILIYREDGKAGVKELFKRSFDYKRIKSKIWYLPVLLLEPFIVFVQYGLALLKGIPAPAPQFTWLVPLAYIGFFFGVFAEELGWMGYALDPMQERWSGLKSSIILGIMWATFHAPVWVLVGASFYWAFWQFIYVVATRVLFIWLYNNTGKSLFAIALIHPGMGIYWYLWPVSANLGIPSFYDPRNLALTAIVLATIVTFLWGSKTLAEYRYVRSSESHVKDKYQQVAADK